MSCACGYPQLTAWLKEFNIIFWNITFTLDVDLDLEIVYLIKLTKVPLI